MGFRWLGHQELVRMSVTTTPFPYGWPTVGSCGYSLYVTKSFRSPLCGTTMRATFFFARMVKEKGNRPRDPPPPPPCRSDTLLPEAASHPVHHFPEGLRVRRQLLSAEPPEAGGGGVVPPPSNIPAGGVGGGGGGGDGGEAARNWDVRLPGTGNSNSHGARPGGKGGAVFPPSCSLGTPPSRRPPPPVAPSPHDAWGGGAGGFPPCSSLGTPEVPKRARGGGASGGCLAALSPAGGGMGGGMLRSVAWVGMCCKYRTSEWPRAALQALYTPHPLERDIDNLLVRIHFIIVMIRWTGLAPIPFSR